MHFARLRGRADPNPCSDRCTNRAADVAFADQHRCADASAAINIDRRTNHRTVHGNARTFRHNPANTCTDA